MNYLFFDTECSNTFYGIGKIVEFGYVLVDEQFNVIEKNQFCMSPGKGGRNQFHLKGGGKEIQLSHDKDFYYSQPEFDYFYESIKHLLENEDTVALAWASINDISYLYCTCGRYHLSQYLFKCYDSQKIFKSSLDVNGPISLAAAYKNCVVEEENIILKAHSSLDDSKMQMRLIKHICLSKNISLFDLLKEYEHTSILTDDYINERRELKRKKRVIRYYNKAIEEDKCLISNSDIVGLRYSVSSNIIRTDKIYELIKVIHSSSGILVEGLRNADIFIVDSKLSDDVITKHLIAHPSLKIIEVNTFLITQN